MIKETTDLNELKKYLKYLESKKFDMRFVYGFYKTREMVALKQQIKELEEQTT